MCLQTQPIPIPLAPLSTLVPRLRCSVEGLNQELEAMLICQPPHTQHRVMVSSSQHTKCVKRLHANHLRKLNTISCFFLSSSCQLLDVPDGHRAPVPLQSSSSSGGGGGSQSDTTTTPLSSSSMSSSPSPPPTNASTFPPNPEYAPLDMRQGLSPNLKD